LKFYYSYHLGTRAIQADVAGPVAVILLTVVIAMRWKTDNPRQVYFYYSINLMDLPPIF
jgi:hypothetical protein